MYPAEDSYSPGDRATVVGYTGGHPPGWTELGPFRAVLASDPVRASSPLGEAVDIDLGAPVIQETGRGGSHGFRLAITFTVPDVAPGLYTIEVVGADPAVQIGGFSYAPLWVDVDPGQPVTRNWPLDDPARSGATAEVPLPPPPTTTPPPTIASPTTLAPTTTTEAPSTSRPQATSPTEIATETIVSPTGPSEPTTEGSRPGWVLLALGLGTMGVVGGAALRSRRTGEGPTSPR